MDLRKPKIFGDFNIDNKYGISNYLTDELNIDTIINKTKFPNWTLQPRDLFHLTRQNF
jgi:hypothetical protein